MIESKGALGAFVLTVGLFGLVAACGDGEDDTSTTTTTTASGGGEGGTSGSGGATPTQDCDALATAAQAALDQSLLDEKAEVPDRVGGTVAAILTRDCRWVGATGNATEATLADAARPMRADSILGIASVSKTYVAAATMIAAEEGSVSLDAPLTTYVTTSVPNEDDITLRQLLQHTSGVRGFNEDLDFLQQAFTHPNTPITPQELVDVSTNLGAKSPPGAAYHYSNTNYVLLGMVLEQVSGQSLTAYLREKILSPAGLMRTWHLEATPEAPATGYFDVDAAPAYPPSLFWASGAITADALDITVWIRDLVTGDVLTEASRAEMQTYVPLPFADFYSGLGLLRYDHPVFGTTVGHDGAIPGYASEVYVVPDHDVTVGIITNSRLSEDYEVWNAMAAVAVDFVATGP